MAQSVQKLKCKRQGCEDVEFYISLEWMGLIDAKTEIEKTKCPKCNEIDTWYFTDSFEN